MLNVWSAEHGHVFNFTVTFTTQKELELSKGHHL